MGKWTDSVQSSTTNSIKDPAQALHNAAFACFSGDAQGLSGAQIANGIDAQFGINATQRSV